MTDKQFDEFAEQMQVNLLSVAVENWRGDYDKLRIDTDRGSVACRLYDAKNAQSAVVMVGGAGGGFDSPAGDLYGRLCDKLRRTSISALRVAYRNSRNLEEAVHDVRAAIRFLEADEALTHIGLIGYSFGGAVVIQAAALEPNVDVVITLASQSYGTEAVSDLSKPLLLIHGKQDEILPSACSESLYKRAGGPKELFLADGGYDLKASERQIFDRCFDWMLANLRKAAS